MDKITLKNVRFSYPRGDFELVCDSFSLQKGEICLITGENGSGKTTLLKLCAGILRCENATLSLFGEDVTNASLGKIGGKIGYLFQEPSRQLFCATVWDEMTFVGAIRGENEKILQEKAVHYLGLFGLTKLAQRSTYRLSRGEKQRLAIAAILMHDIEYLIFDEPTTGLDKENRQRLYKIIENLAEKGVGIAIISHDTELLNRFSTARGVRVSEGEIVLGGGEL